MLYITKPCPVCHETSTIHIEEEKFERWVSGELIQKVWPHMTPDDRELLITGTHPACWEKIFGR